mmetsp:Transcript_15199/g.35696  ORF Transcript_15199/g.35696 Transcript_15199/m.35696 type:complete len:201 (+) Transcript_15199:406-1008(+)
MRSLCAVGTRSLARSGWTGGAFATGGGARPCLNEGRLSRALPPSPLWCAPVRASPPLWSRAAVRLWPRRSRRRAGSWYGARSTLSPTARAGVHQVKRKTCKAQKKRWKGTQRCSTAEAPNTRAIVFARVGFRQSRSLKMGSRKALIRMITFSVVSIQGARIKPISWSTKKVRLGGNSNLQSSKSSAGIQLKSLSCSSSES